MVWDTVSPINDDTNKDYSNWLGTSVYKADYNRTNVGQFN